MSKLTTDVMWQKSRFYHTAKTRFFSDMPFSRDVRLCWASCVYEISENQKRAGCRNMDQKSNMPPNWDFPPFANPKDFFSKSGSVTFVSLWCHNFMQKLEKSNRKSLRYLKTTHGRTNGPKDRGDYIGSLQIKWGLKYKLICKLICTVCFAILAQVLFVKLSSSFIFIDLWFAVTWKLMLNENNDHWLKRLQAYLE